MSKGSARSPFAASSSFACSLEQHNSPGAMGIRMPDPAVNHAAFSLVIASLYSPSVVRNLTLDNAFATLAAAVFLGLEDVAALAAELCDSSIRKLRKPGEMASWFGKLKDAGEAFGASGRGGEVYGAGWSRGGGGGTATVSGACREGTGAKVAPRFGYGALGARLWVSLLRRVLALPEEYGLVEGGEDLSQGHERMVLLLSALPFEVLKVSFLSRDKPAPRCRLTMHVPTEYVGEQQVRHPWRRDGTL